MSDSNTGIVVFITGYGPFGEVKVNPSSAIALRVVEDLKRHPDVVDVRYTELDVSVSSVLAFFEKVESEISQIIDKYGAGKVKILLCHLGVHTDTTGLIRIEVQGYNELFATIPDVDGRVLNHEPIVQEDGGVEMFHESWFGREGSSQLKYLQSLVEQLNGASATSKHKVTSADSNSKDMVMPSFQAPCWAVSRDAGRYLCNCALYRALRLQEKNPGVVYGIFIHVVNPLSGKTEVEGGPIVAYNPTVVVQAEQLKGLMRGLLSIMTL
ncbi:hypothetical protein JKF63_01765 [Porcisia hertigi]|uniref:Pyroglutamyl-peptidase I n=1 Tax=Porcisia hertigi TaxID=2761500 RepID=A0A836IGD7_9TRYP|nr:hypothetical protein JKF63_01765 [Porcisia hertigi]